MKLVTTEFKSGGWGATWEACSGNLESWEPSHHLLLDTGKPRKTCVEVAGRRNFRILTSRLWFTKYIPIFPQRHSYVCYYKTRRLCFAKGTNWIFIYHLGGSIIRIFHRLSPSRPHYGPGIASTSNINEYQEYFLESKGGRRVGLTLPL